MKASLAAQKLTQGGVLYGGSAFQQQRGSFNVETKSRTGQSISDVRPVVEQNRDNSRVSASRSLRESPLDVATRARIQQRLHHIRVSVVRSVPKHLCARTVVCVGPVRERA